MSECPLYGPEAALTELSWSLACNTTILVSDNNFTSILSHNHDNNATSYFPDEWEDSAVRKFAYAIWLLDLYFIPVLIIVGLVGNSISFFVFMRYLHRLSPSIYLAGLALVDTGFLLLLLVSWSNNIGFHLYNEQGWCQLFTYLTYVCSFLSVAFVVSFSVERYVAVCMPLQRRKVCTRRKARIVVICLVVYACILYNFAIWTSSVQETEYGTYCLPRNKYYRLVAYVNNVDSILTLVIPSIVIVVTNSRIILTMMRVSGHRNRFSEGVRSRGSSRFSRRSRCGSSSDLYHSQDVPRSHARRAHFAQTKITKMLITVSSMFVFLNMPSHAMRIYAFARFMLDNSYEPSKICFLVQRLFLDFYYINFSINFFLYSICGKNFRLALRHSCRRMRCCLRRCCRLPFTKKGSSRNTRSFELDTPPPNTPQASQGQSNNTREESVPYRALDIRLPNIVGSDGDVL